MVTQLDMSDLTLAIDDARLREARIQAVKDDARVDEIGRVDPFADALHQLRAASAPRKRVAPPPRRRT